MDVRWILCGCFCAVSLVSAVALIFARTYKLISLAVLFEFVGVALIFLMLGDDLLAFLTIFCGVGNTMIVLAYGGATTNPIPKAALVATHRLWRWPTIGFSLFIALCVFFVLRDPLRQKDISLLVENNFDLEMLGRRLIENHLVGFELVAVILFLGLFGSRVLARIQQ